jgi:uncharacterized protein YndB with AHSA1/START domain
MALQTIDVRATIPAEPAAVWRLLGDSATWPQWTPVERFELERPGDASGLGEIRAFTTGRVTVREEIVEREPERVLTYTLLSGLALRDYRARIELSPAPGGTALRWHTTFRPKVPGAGFLYRRALDRITRQFVDGLASRASSDSAQGAPAG